MTDTQAVLEQIARKLDALAELSERMKADDAWVLAYRHAARIVREGGAA
jgi:hypothetical protein